MVVLDIKYIQARAISTTQSQFTEDDLIIMWKGLDYCMWMCDESLVQVKKIKKHHNLQKLQKFLFL
jgi:hypothetical protein